jgi:hypothetical protein
VPIDAESGFWVPPLFGKQADVFNSSARACLLSGPSLSGKSWASMNKIVRHLWDTPNASVAFFSKIIKTAYESGSWDLLHKSVMPDWINGGIGIQYTTKTANGNWGPKVSGTSRTPTFSIRNRYGGESTCRLFSLEHDQDIEDKVKDHFFSMIYFSELDKFKDRKILSLTLNRLRMPHLKFEQQMWLADTNPAEDGEKFWAYEVFYKERVWTYAEYLENCRTAERMPMPEVAFLRFQKGLQLIELFPEDNPHLDPQQLDELKAQYAYDPELYARYVEGKWVFGFGNDSRHLRAHFKPHHIIGTCESAKEEDWEVALPSPVCVDVGTGWDIGDAVNHAMVIVEPVYQGGKIHYVVLDEHVSIGEAVSTRTFTEGALSKINALEGIVAARRGEAFKFPLTNCYSDNSILRFSAHADDYPYMVVSAASGGRITLDAMEQSEKAMRVRVQLVKQLLSENRLHVSANCKFLIRMFRELRKGNTKSDFIYNDENKHVFDALTFYLIKECSEELLTLPGIETNTSAKREFSISA